MAHIGSVNAELSGTASSLQSALSTGLTTVLACIAGALWHPCWKLRVRAARPVAAIVGVSHYNLRPRDLGDGIWTIEAECCGSVGCRQTASRDEFDRVECQSGELVGLDNAPGIAGYDDDNDGGIDWADEQVQKLMLQLCSDGINNATGQIGDNCAWDSNDLPTAWGDALLAAHDDDENGYIDDAHGVDFEHMVYRFTDPAQSATSDSLEYDREIRDHLSPMEGQTITQSDFRDSGYYESHEVNTALTIAGRCRQRIWRVWHSPRL